MKKSWTPPTYIEFFQSNTFIELRVLCVLAEENSTGSSHVRDIKNRAETFNESILSLYGQKVYAKFSRVHQTKWVFLHTIKTHSFSETGRKLLQFLSENIPKVYFSKFSTPCWLVSLLTAWLTWLTRQFILSPVLASHNLIHLGGSYFSQLLMNFFRV